MDLVSKRLEVAALLKRRYFVAWQMMQARSLSPESSRGCVRRRRLSHDTRRAKPQLLCKITIGSLTDCQANLVAISSLPHLHLAWRTLRHQFTHPSLNFFLPYCVAECADKYLKCTQSCVQSTSLARCPLLVLECVSATCEVNRFFHYSKYNRWPYRILRHIRKPKYNQTLGE
ncbi:hypothetical protein L228DRAFT_45611 [Xylona heveae TC161]|uniref:Uncharacterized protein n=1 Tax=Xylona heveae (strain CBS 132557 / TC161) TaxID=1328760 RepID=A0A164ZUD1_XYLHT|nr:hypothetical protein L228DRAFT_45611 [Xylona heveae TC161]KZF19533.1 hypothetical protein L228DRAFT_45611 [Xylona heveae TC161]